MKTGRNKQSQRRKNLFTKALTEWEGPKNIPAAPVFEFFFSVASCKKYSKNGAAGKFFAPSYFDPAS